MGAALGAVRWWLLGEVGLEAAHQQKYNEDKKYDANNTWHAPSCPMPGTPWGHGQTPKQQHK